MNIQEGMKVNGFEVAKVSKKGAALLRINGRQGWITPSAFDKFFETGHQTPKIKAIAKTGDLVAVVEEKFEAVKKEAFKNYSDFQKLNGEICEETEKAYKIQRRVGTVWVPKSVVELDGTTIMVKSWFFFKNLM